MLVQARCAGRSGASLSCGGTAHESVHSGAGLALHERLCAFLGLVREEDADQARRVIEEYRQAPGSDETAEIDISGMQED